jgi:hypothetical protein
MLCWGQREGVPTTKIVMSNAANPPQIAVAAAINPITAKAMPSLAKWTMPVQWERGTTWVFPSMAACLNHMMCVATAEVARNG